MKIGDKVFKTKKEAKAFCKEILSKYCFWENLLDEDFAFVVELLNFHPESKHKIGVGVDRIYAMPSPIYKTKCFAIRRVDGTATDFSYLACVDGYKAGDDQTKAMRRAILPQILDFKRRDNTITCPITGEPLTPESTHIDHVFPKTFSALAREWMSIEGIKIEDIETTPPGDMQSCAEMSNNRQRESWIKFHKDNAILRAISKTANEKLGNKGENDNGQ